MDERQPPKLQESLETQYPLSISCRRKKKSWLIWNQSLVFIFYLATAGATVVCHLYFPHGKHFLWRKQDWQASFTHFLIHSFIHFPLKREKKNPCVLFKGLLSNLSWNNWNPFVVTVQCFFLFSAMWVFSAQEPFLLIILRVMEFLKSKTIE